jgi:hypothetical protein
MATQCRQGELDLGRSGGRKLVGAFDGGAITSNGGVVLLAAADKRIGLSRRLASCFTDLRFADAVRHAVTDLLRQRIFGIALGHEDLIDHDALRDGDAIERVFVDLFLDAHRQPPIRIVLDLDATDDPVYGDQEGRHFHGYYDCYCYLPLYIFCGRHLLAAKLRTSSVDAADGSVAEVSRIVAQIRDRWPQTTIVIRADSGFCRDDS